MRMLLDKSTKNKYLLKVNRIGISLLSIDSFIYMYFKNILKIISISNILILFNLILFYLSKNLYSIILFYLFN